MSDIENLKLFQRSYDYYEWIYPHLKNFPKSERFTLVQHIENTLLDFIEEVISARKSEETVDHLRQADQNLEKLKVFLRLSKDLEFVSMGQYKESSERLDDIGRLLGGWLESEK